MKCSKKSPADAGLQTGTRFPAIGFFLLVLSSLLGGGIVLGTPMPAVAMENPQGEDTLTFAIHEYQITGNTVLPEALLAKTVASLTGEGKTAADVEKARNALETLYRQQGYPTVIVNIPEQNVNDGMVDLEVVEARIRILEVTGNRFFTKEKIIEDLPSFAPGEILYMPRARRELNLINRNPDFKVAPVLMPGKYPGTVDVEMKVKDKLPLHGSLELNNRSTHSTSDLRLNGTIHYDNLWQKEHSISFQFQVSPQDTSEVQALSGSYLVHTPWNDDHLLALFAVWSDSDTAFGDQFEVIGKGFLVGCRYVIPLPVYHSYAHNITIGLDYKDFDEKLDFAETGDASDDETVPIVYMPLSFAYGALLPDKTGRTDFKAGLSLGFRGAVNQQEDFENKRFKARGNYMVLDAGVERNQKLPGRLAAWVKLAGRLSDQPLISNEQYVAGGMDSVRGYKESEALGDDALHGMIELRSPDLMRLLDATDQIKITPYAFYDIAALSIKDPLPQEDQHATLQGAGIGVRGAVTRYLSFQVDWGVALEDTDKTEAETARVHFKVKGAF